jgi:hypothetical protein
MKAPLWAAKRGKSNPDERSAVDKIGGSVARICAAAALCINLDRRIQEQEGKAGCALMSAMN